MGGWPPRNPMCSRLFAFCWETAYWKFFWEGLIDQFTKKLGRQVWMILLMSWDWLLLAQKSGMKKKSNPSLRLEEYVSESYSGINWLLLPWKKFVERLVLIFQSETGSEWPFLPLEKNICMGHIDMHLEKGWLASCEALGVRKYMAKHHSFVYTHYIVGMIMMITIRYMGLNWTDQSVLKTNETTA